MAFQYSGTGDAGESGMLEHFNVFSTAITHPCPDSAGKLVQNFEQ
jgi:hypothetical protein